MKHLIPWFVVVWLVHMHPSQASSSPPEPFPRGGAIANKAHKRGRKLPRQNLAATTMFHPSSHTALPSNEPIGTTSSSSSSSSSYAVEIVTPYAPIDTSIEIDPSPLVPLIAPSQSSQPSPSQPSTSQEEIEAEEVPSVFVESMCRPDPGRFALFPIKNTRMWDMYKKHVASFW